MCWDEERENENDLFKTLDTFCYPAHLEEVLIYDKSEYIEIGNEQVLYVNDDERELLTDDWSGFEFRRLEQFQQQD